MGYIHQHIAVNHCLQCLFPKRMKAMLRIPLYAGCQQIFLVPAKGGNAYTLRIQPLDFFSGMLLDTAHSLYSQYCLDMSVFR